MKINWNLIDEFIGTVICVVILGLILFAILSCGHDFSSNGFTNTPTSCTVSSISGGSLIVCPDGTSAFIANGVKGDTGLTGSTGATGATGQDGETSPYLPIAIIEPCGHSSSSYKEVLFVLKNGTILASFSRNLAGDYTRLTLLPDGSYVDTDDSTCSFSVFTVGNIRTASWTGGSQSWVMP